MNKKPVAPESLNYSLWHRDIYGLNAKISLHCRMDITNKLLCFDKNITNRINCSIWRKVKLVRVNSPRSFRPACRNTAQWAEVCSVQTCPTAPQPPLSHWWSCPWDGHVRHAAYQTAGQTRALKYKDTKFHLKTALIHWRAESHECRLCGDRKGSKSFKWN